jgi:hypothetical protein
MSRLFLRISLVFLFLLILPAHSFCQSANFMTDITRIQYWDDTGINIDYDFSEGKIQPIDWCPTCINWLALPESAVKSGSGPFGLINQPNPLEGANVELHDGVLTAGVLDTTDHSPTIAVNMWTLVHSSPLTPQTATWIISWENFQNTALLNRHAYATALGFLVLQDGILTDIYKWMAVWTQIYPATTPLLGMSDYALTTATGGFLQHLCGNVSGLDPASTSLDLKVELVHPYRMIASYRLDGGEWVMFSDRTYQEASPVPEVRPWFAIAAYYWNLLTVSKNGTGTGTVTSSTGQINCGETCFDVSNNTPLTLTAIPDPGSTFAGWSGGCTDSEPTCSFMMSEDKNVTATFDLLPPEQLIEQIITGVTNLKLPTAVENSYMGNLKKVSEAIDQGSVMSAMTMSKSGDSVKNLKAAINQLDAFIKKVTTDIAHENISAADGNKLIAMANVLIGELNAP